MSQKFLLAWAIGATALALILLGYMIGRTGGGPNPAPLSVAANLATSTETGPSVQPEPADPYLVPVALAGMPAEWRTPFRQELAGYAILFDLKRRELIVEQCAHPGYFDEGTGREILQNWEFCEPVLWSRLVEIDETSVKAIDRRRGRVELELAADREADPPSLSLSFGDHDMRLIPGSKNDLFQAMDRSSAIEQQRDKVIKMLMAKEKAKLRLMEEARQTGVQPGPDTVPVYTLPASASEAREQRRILAEGELLHSGSAGFEDRAAEERRMRDEGGVIEQPSVPAVSSGEALPVPQQPEPEEDTE